MIKAIITYKYDFTTLSKPTLVATIDVYYESEKGPGCQIASKIMENDILGSQTCGNFEKCVERFASDMIDVIGQAWALAGNTKEIKQ